MELIKQIVEKNYQKYTENLLNGRFFPYEIGNAIALADVVMEEFDSEISKETIDDLNALNRIYYTLPYEKSKKIADKEKRKVVYMRVRDVVEKMLVRKLNDVMIVILEFFKKFENVEVVEEIGKQYYSKGVVAVIHPFFPDGSQNDFRRGFF